MISNSEYKKSKPNIDYGFLTIIFLLLGLGVVMVFSSSFYYVLQNPSYSEFFFLKEQLLRVCLAFILFFIGYKVSYKFWGKISGFLVIFSIILLLITLFMGREVHGARRWLSLATFSLQPSEFVKMSLVLYLASFFSKKEDCINNFKKYTLPPFIISGIIILIVVLQPHFSTAFIIATIVGIMFFVGKIKLRYIFGALFLGLLVFALLFLVFPYARMRIVNFLKGETYQVLQSRIAMGSGGLFGTGLGEGKQKFMFLPGVYTDFILAVIGEELGFLGVSIVAFLFLAYLFKALSIAHNVSTKFASYMAVGLGIIPFLHFLIHFGVNLGILPTTGIPLPFISFGGSAIAANMLGTGILLNISKEVENENVHSYGWDRRSHLSGYSIG